MDDGSCVVCADALEWVAYGFCGHRDVCATCIARLRFVCHDRRCCICKSDSPFVFITKALGSFTRKINDFSILPANAKDGKVGSYWFHEDTQAYFDDFDQYRIIKAMCKLSCSVCDKLEVEGRKNSKRKGKFKNVEQLKDHLSRQHELFFCDLCLENKKVFICEQKLYSRVQLRQHIRDGGSEVDGDEDERCGFSGHPLCEFCQRPFYGDNELYFHLSTDHYTCHICQRQHPNHHEYYKDYDDLENHFRQDHYLCEDDSCLEKKFVVFASEADLKRHKALEHGGHMSRAKRNAALQLPTCFRHQEREQETQYSRPRFSGRGVPGQPLLFSATTNAARTGSSSQNDATLIAQSVPGHSRASETSSILNPVPSSGQAQGDALDFRSVLLSGSDFPALPRTSKRRRRKSKKTSEGTSSNSTAAPVFSSNAPPSALSTAPQAASQAASMASTSSSQYGVSSTAISSQNRLMELGHSASSRLMNPSNLNAPTSNGTSSGNSINNTSSIKGMGSSSSSTLNRVNGASGLTSASAEPSMKGGDQTANKSLVESIRAALDFDKDKYTAFKIFSKEYREGEIDAGEYFAYVHQFGLAHLVLDLARLCPDPQKQKELMEIYKTSLGNVEENGQRRETCERSGNKGSNRGKEKREDTTRGASSSSTREEALPESIVNHLTKMKLEESEPHQNGKPSSSSSASNSIGSTSTKNKKKSQKSKFLKARLGESSESGAQDLGCSNSTTYSMAGGPSQDSILASVRGVWRNGGGRRLVAMNQALSR